mmetsp:Transcript_12932/g.26746  ORF Transcript_12932/g.26746 Transcript_12932/m.26746 type:complete len:103 (-) Transcript_12932:1460-1768(-)
MARITINNGGLIAALRLQLCSHRPSLWTTIEMTLFLRYASPIVRLFQFLHETNASRDDGILIQFSMATVVVRHTLLHINGFLDAIHLIYIPAVVEKNRRGRY